MSSYLFSKANPNFSVSMNENNWIFDNNKILKSVFCHNGKDDEGEIVPVVWDGTGAYVPHNNEKIYVLEHTA